MMLREAREKRGLTLSDVAAMTRIPKTMLVHLENDRFEEYAAEVFLRGHLRNYARELLLDSEVVLQAYERFTGRRKEEANLEVSRVSAPRPLTRALAVASAPMGSEQSASRAQSEGTHQGGGFSSIRPSHLVAAILILLGILVMVSFLSSNRATAQDTAAFPEADPAAWELDREIEETRWLLERTDRRDD